MTDRVALLIGTPKGAFILDGDAWDGYPTERAELMKIGRAHV